MKRSYALNAVASLVACLSLIACSSGGSGNGTTVAEADDEVIQADSFDNLPNCSAKREGRLASVNGTTYSCNDGVWEELGAEPESFEFYDDIPNCTPKREGLRVFVEEEDAVLVCKDREWIKGSEAEEESSSSVGSSSSSTKRSSSSVSSSSSSTKRSSSSDANDTLLYDCSVYNCVVTTYLNQDMLAAGEYGEYLDTRDNQVYRTVVIGTQTWMAQNLNYAGENSECYSGDTVNCRTYGRLYYWSAISDSESENQGILQGPCFDGWHVPTDEEFLTLLEYVGNKERVDLSREYTSWPEYYSYGNSANVLKSAVYEWDNGPFSDEYGFSALPSGFRWDYGSYANLGGQATYWTNSVADVYWGPRTITRRVGGDSYAGAHWDLLDYMYSIRCLKN